MADLVRYLRDRGVIVQEQGVWVLASGLPALHNDLPESIRGMIQRKIAQLSDDDRRLLVAASVQGNEFDSAILAMALGLDQTVVEERLEALDSVFSFVSLVGDHEFPNGRSRCATGSCTSCIKARSTRRCSQRDASR